MLFYVLSAFSVVRFKSHSTLHTTLTHDNYLFVSIRG